MFSSWCTLVLTAVGFNLRLWRDVARLITSAAFRRSVFPDHRIQRWTMLRRTEQLESRGSDWNRYFGGNFDRGVLQWCVFVSNGAIVMLPVKLCFRCLWIIPSLMVASLGDQPIAACIGWTCAVSATLYGGWRARAHALQVAADGMSRNELREELRTYELSTSGSKAELKQRLTECSSRW